MRSILRSGVAMTNVPDETDALMRAGTSGLTGEQLDNARKVAEQLLRSEQAPGTPTPPEG